MAGAREQGRAGGCGCWEQLAVQEISIAMAPSVPALSCSGSP